MRAARFSSGFRFTRRTGAAPRIASLAALRRCDDCPLPHWGPHSAGGPA